MATEVTDISTILGREINVPGFEQLPDVTTVQLNGYVKDGFWHLRLRGVMSGYTQDDGQALTPPTTGDAIYQVSDEGDVPPELQRLIAIAGGFRMLRLKILNLAINFRAKAGPAEFEQQASATTLRRIMDSLERELQELVQEHSDTLGSAGFWYMDGMFQAEVAELQGLPELSVLT